MTSKGVLEKPNEFLSVVDPLTKGIIYCVNRGLLHTPGWSKRWLSETIRHIDVTDTKPFSSNAFTHDSFVDQGGEDTFINMFIDFACMIHEELVLSGKVVVHCKNGRSRSPQVILAFMMLRGIPREHCIQWLTLAFRTQRPTIHDKSAAFPNFQKFANVTVALEKRCSDHRSDIESRVKTNISNTDDVYLSGAPWNGTWGKPTNFNMFLSVTSFCPAPGTYSTSGTRSKSGGGNRRKSKRVTKPETNVNIHATGRRVKVLFESTGNKKTRKRKRQEHKVGTLLLKNSSNKWQIDFDDRTMQDEPTMQEFKIEDIIAAFPPGTRVQVWSIVWSIV